MGYLPPTTPAEGMDGDKLGEEIATEINRSFRLSGLLSSNYIFGSRYSVLMWQAIGRAIVSHIQKNMVVTTPVVDYHPGLVTTEFPSNEVK